MKELDQATASENVVSRSAVCLEFDLNGSEGLDGMEVVHTKPQKIFSSSALATVYGWSSMKSCNIARSELTALAQERAISVVFHHEPCAGAA